MEKTVGDGITERDALNARLTAIQIDQGVKRHSGQSVVLTQSC